MNPSPRSAPTHALAVLLFVATALVMLYPQSLRLWDTIWFVGDPLDSVYFVGWTARQIVTDPLHLFDANILYPHSRAALFDTPRLLPGLVAAPVIWATDNPILGYNLAMVSIYAFTAWCGWVLARSLGLEPIGAWAAGALYAFHTYELSESPRINTIFHGFLALALMELVRYYRTGERRHAWRVAALMLLQGLADQYHLLYGTLLLVLVTLVAVIARPRGRLRQLAFLPVPALVAALLFLPVISGYISMARTYGYEREVAAGVDLANYLATSPTNLLYGDRSGSARLARTQGPHFTGFVSLSLAGLALGAWVSRRGARAPAPLLPERVWVPLAAVFFVLLVVLSMGPELRTFGHSLGSGPYLLLYKWVPGFAYLRLPERLSLLAMLFLGLLAGRGVSLVRARFGLFPAAALAFLLPVEHMAPLPDVTPLPVGENVPQVYRWLADQPARAVAEVPINGEGLVRYETLEEYFSLFHRKPVIHGFVTFEPLLSTMLRRAADEFPSDYSLQAFSRVGVDTVIVHEGRIHAEPILEDLPGALRAGRLERLARFGPEPPWAFGGGVQQVYRVLPPSSRLAAAPFPEGTRRRDPAWRYWSEHGSYAAAGDGDLNTAWEVGDREQTEILQVTFRGHPLRISGVVIPLTRSSAFPEGFAIEGKWPDGAWETFARFDDAHRIQLVDRLRASPGGAEVGFDLGGRELLGVRLVSQGGRSFMGWKIPELEIRIKD